MAALTRELMQLCCSLRFVWIASSISGVASQEPSGARLKRFSCTDTPSVRTVKGWNQL